MTPSPDAMFSVANSVALAGWIALLALPRLPRLADAIAGTAIPLLMAIAYTGLVLASWSRAEGGFGSLADVMRLFDSPTVALASSKRLRRSMMGTTPAGVASTPSRNGGALGSGAGGW